MSCTMLLQQSCNTILPHQLCIVVTLTCTCHLTKSHIQGVLCDTCCCCRYMAMWLAAIGGEVIKLDHSHKATKRVKDSTGEQQFAAVLTIMNEFCQVGHVGCAYCLNYKLHVAWSAF